MQFLSKLTADCLPALDVAVLWRFLDSEDDKDDTHVICTNYEYQAGLNPEHAWNVQGREILNARTCARFSAGLAQLVERMGCHAMLVRHWHMDRDWMPPPAAVKKKQGPEVEILQQRVIQYIQTTLPPRYQGCLLLESSAEITEFLMALLAYPTVFAYLDLYMFCMSEPVAFELSHHANVVVYSTSRDVMDRVKQIAAAVLPA
jgi:hypothetical protein